MKNGENPFMAYVETLSERAEVAIPRADGDYIGENGLLYCGKCNTPKECIPVPELPNFKPRCLCKCAKENQEAEERERKKAERVRMIEQNRKSGITDLKILKYTFENDKYPESEISVRLRKYCAEWKKALDNNLGLLLWGGCGVGKSFYAGCVANSLIDNGVRALCTSIPKLINGIFSAEYKNAYINSIVEYPFLVIDDLGTERGTEYALEQLFTLIDERYKSNLPTIITTNLNPRDMAAVNDIAYKRIYDRVTEMCVPMYVKGEAQRTAAAKSKAQMLKDILGEKI